MKWIKKRSIFLNEEAKIKDVIFPKQASAIKANWGSEYLELEEIEPTDNINQGKWEISEEDKINILGVFFMCDLQSIYDFLGSLPDQLNEIIKLSVKPELFSDEKTKKTMENFDIKKPSIDQISYLSTPVFRKISVSETQATEVLVKDERGRPVMGEDGRPMKRAKEKGEVFFTNNLVNINSFISDFNRCYPDSAVVDTDKFQSGEIQKLISTSSDTKNGEYNVDYNIFAKKMYLSIKHNPKDILNISISKYYTSCQHLYTGGYNELLLGNVFDPNSIPAFIVFDTPITWDKEVISDHLPLCRMMVRNLESFDTTEKPKIYFDRCYPDRMEDVMGEIIEKYSNNIQTSEGGETYLYTPDLPTDIKNQYEPYMDRLELQKGLFIGTNIKKLYLSSNIDWSRVKISNKAKLEEIVIETTRIPENLLSLPLNPTWIKFKFLKLRDLSVFKNIKTNSFAFDKCKFSGNILDSIKESNPNITKLQLVACDTNGLNLSKFQSLEELQLIFSIEDKIKDVITGLKIGKLVISSDILMDKENKAYINSLKSMGTKVEVVGPKI